MDDSQLQPVTPLATAHLFAGLNARLVALLAALDPGGWDAVTACAPWTVRDVAAHLLDTDLRQLSIYRDHAPLIQPPQPIRSHGDLVAFLDTLNGQWIVAARRLSPQVLVGLLAHVGEQVAAFYAGLDMDAPSPFGVGWAGEDRSATWFHVAREYTEKWHHQQHIRDAVGAPGLLEAEYGGPAIATFLRALPFAYRGLKPSPGASVTVAVAGPAGGVWTLGFTAQGWRLYLGELDQADARVQLDAEVAWRLFTKGISPDQARAASTVHGDPHLAAPFFATVSILA